MKRLFVLCIVTLFVACAFRVHAQSVKKGGVVSLSIGNVSYNHIGIKPAWYIETPDVLELVGGQGTTSVSVKGIAAGTGSVFCIYATEKYDSDIKMWVVDESKRKYFTVTVIDSGGSGGDDTGGNGGSGGSGGNGSGCDDSGSSSEAISFVDDNVKAICVDKWDTNRDGELSYYEASKVTSLNGNFRYSDISSFDELEYFTGLTDIDEAFYQCKNLVSINIPSGVTSLIKPFSGCSNLSSIEVATGNPKYDSREGCNGVIETETNTLIIGCKGTVIPNSVTSIGVCAFNLCSGLTSVNIPNSVTSIGVGAFSGCSGLTSVNIPNSVTSISYDAFWGCSSLNSIVVATGNPVYDSREGCNAIIKTEKNQLITGCNRTVIPNSVTSIQSGAFMGRSGLTSVTIPNSVKSIGIDVFSECSSLSSIVVATGNPRYDSREGCNAIIETETNTLIVGCKGTVIPNSVTSIEQDAFSCCTSLTTMTIPNSVTRIGDEAFFYCTSLTTMTIPNSVTSIGSSAFCACSNLKSVTIPNSVTSIGSSAFSGCSNLNSVIVNIEIPLSINNNTFYNCTNATLYVPAGCKEAYKAANYWKEFYKIVELDETMEDTEPSQDNEISFVDNKVKAICVTNWDTNGDGEFSLYEASQVTSLGNVFRGSEISSFDELKYFSGLTSISGNDFRLCKNLVSIIIPNSVITINPWAISGCSSLTSIEVATGNPKYDSREGCKAIIETETNTLIVGCKETVIPNSVTSIGNYAFDECSSLTSVTIPNSVTSIGNYAFYGCSSLTSVTIPNSVTSIGNYAFDKCSSLTSVTIPNSVTSISYGAFFGCSSLTSVSIPNSVTSIGEYAFYKCSSLTSVSIPNSVTSIGKSAFDECSSLTSVTIPNSVTSIGNYAFDKCSSLTSVTIPNGVTSIGENSFFGCSNLTSVSIPNSVTSIGEKAFYNCSSLTSVSIPNSVTSIGEYAFYKCSSLTSVSIPNSMTSIGNYAFSLCRNLNTVIVNMKVPCPISDYTFTNSTNATLYVPAGCKEAYETANYWKDFKEIVEMEETIEDTEPDNQETELSQHDNTIYIENVEAQVGDEFNLSIRMKNTAAIRGFQFNLHLPEGVTAQKSAKGKYLATLTPNRLPDEDEHTLTVTEQEDGSLLFLCGSQYNENFTGNDGEIATLAVRVDENMAVGDYPLVLENIQLTETNITKYYNTDRFESILTIEDYVLGDINRDREVNVRDYIGVANHILGDSPEGFNAKAADVDKSGDINVRDYIGVANIILTGSPYGASASARELNNRRANTDISDIENVIYAAPLTAEAGTQAQLSICMKNTAAIRGFQFNLYLPEGVTVAKSKKGKVLATLTEDRLPDEDEHTLTVTEQADGSALFLCGSQYRETFTGTDGEIISVTLNIDENMTTGEYPIVLQNIQLTETDISKFYNTDRFETTLTVGTPQTVLLGDANLNGEVTVSDATLTVNFALEKETPTEEQKEAADVNQSGSITVADAVGIVGIILGAEEAGARPGTMGNVLAEDLNYLEIEENAISLYNETNFTAFQLDVTLGGGISLNGVSLTDRAKEHMLDWHQVAENTWRIVALSLSNALISQNGGELLVLDIEGEGSITISGVEFVDVTAKPYVLEVVNNGITTGLENVKKTKDYSEIYTVNGVKLDRPQHGLHIVRQADGSVRKVVVK